MKRLILIGNAILILSWIMLYVSYDPQSAAIDRAIVEAMTFNG